SRSAAWARRRNSPTSPASWRRTRAPTSPAPPSMSMAAVRRWSSPHSRAWPQAKRPPSPEAFSLSDGVLGGLDRPGPDDLPGRLGLEHHLFAREGVGALAGLGRGLLDHDELRKARHKEYAALLELLVSDVDERVHHVLDVALGKFGGGRDLLDQLRLRQLGSHDGSIDSGRGTIWRKMP